MTCANRPKPLAYVWHSPEGDKFLDPREVDVLLPTDPICNERGVPESECPTHCRHDHVNPPEGTAP
jgi:hypothetical protein